MQVYSQAAFNIHVHLYTCAGEAAFKMLEQAVKGKLGVRVRVRVKVKVKVGVRVSRQSRVRPVRTCLGYARVSMHVYLCTCIHARAPMHMHR